MRAESIVVPCQACPDHVLDNRKVVHVCLFVRALIMVRAYGNLLKAILPRHISIAKESSLSRRVRAC